RSGVWFDSGRAGKLLEQSSRSLANARDDTWAALALTSFHESRPIPTEQVLAAADRQPHPSFRSLMGTVFRDWVTRLGPAVGLVLVVLVFAVLADSPARYLSSFNLRIVLSQTVIVGLGAIGMTMIVVSGGIDLSVGATIALSSVVTALGIRAGGPPGVPGLPAVLAGGGGGILHGR